jgi:hypothetical protein
VVKSLVNAVGRPTTRPQVGFLAGQQVTALPSLGGLECGQHPAEFVEDLIGLGDPPVVGGQAARGAVHDDGTADKQDQRQQKADDGMLVHISIFHNSPRPVARQRCPVGVFSFPGTPIRFM